jgi:dienelactone hydrolase
VRFEDPQWEFLRPEQPSGSGVLLLAGSSGRVDSHRAQVLRAHGATVLAIRWFGGPGQQPGPFEVPIELIVNALDHLEPHVDTLAIVGTSFGGEAALLTASIDLRIRATVGFAASSVVWPGWNGHAWTSHWTWQGHQVPFVPLDSTWEPAGEPPSFLALYERGLQHQDGSTGSIPVERIAGTVLLVAGGDDLVWPSVRFDEQIAERRRKHGLTTEVVSHPHAGHRVTLPGETPPTSGMTMARGGTREADAALGTAAWPAIARALQLRA